MVNNSSVKNRVFCITLFIALFVSIIAMVGTVSAEVISNPPYYPSDYVFVDRGLLWSSYVGHVSDKDHPSSPCVADGVVYVAAWNPPYVYALNASSGAQLWSYHTPYYASFFSSPCVAYGVAYVGAVDGYIYALNASSGDQLWNYSTGEVRSSPFVTDGVVYIGSFDGIVYALDASSGVQLWNYSTGGNVRSSPCVADGVVCVNSYDYVYALNASSGARLWHYQVGGYGVTNPCIFHHVLYVSADDRPSGCVYAFAVSSGEILWDSWIDCLGVSSPCVSQDYVFICGSDGYLRALWRNSGYDVFSGQILWNWASGDPGNSSRAMPNPCFANDIVYVGSIDWGVYGVGIRATTGWAAWSNPLDNEYSNGTWLFSAPVFVDNVLYVSAGDYVYAFGYPSDLITITSEAYANGLQVVVDSTYTTGVHATINGVSAGSSITAKSVNYGVDQPYGTGTFISGGAYFYDLQVTSGGSTLGSGVDVEVTIYNSGFAAGDVMRYWDGANWQLASNQHYNAADHSLTGTIPASALGGTPIAVGGSGGLFVTPEYVFGGLLAFVACFAAFAVCKKRSKISGLRSIN